MYRFVLALAALLPLAAAAQPASKETVTAVSSVAECLAIGLPREWKELLVVVELPEPYAEKGAVRYQVTLPDDTDMAFVPCDPNLAPVKLLALRDSQSEGDRGWTMLILTMQPDASFNIRYQYPRPANRN